MNNANGQGELRVAYTVGGAGRWNAAQANGYLQVTARPISKRRVVGWGRGVVGQPSRLHIQSKIAQQRSCTSFLGFFFYSGTIGRRVRARGRGRPPQGIRAFHRYGAVEAIDVHERTTNKGAPDRGMVSLSYNRTRHGTAATASVRRRQPICPSTPPRHLLVHNIPSRDATQRASGRGIISK